MSRSAPARSNEVRCLRPPIGDDRGGHHGRREADGQVDEQHPAPAELLGDHPPEQRPGGTARAVHRAPQPDRAMTSGTGLERGGDDRQRRGGHQRTGEALERPGADEHAARRRDASHQRGHGEERQSGDEGPPLAPQVAGTAGQHEEAREDDRVGIDDPLQVRGRELQARLDRRKRDVDDRQVEDDHELRDAAHGQEQSLSARGRPRGQDRLGRRQGVDAGGHGRADRAASRIVNSHRRTWT